MIFNRNTLRHTIVTTLAAMRSEYDRKQEQAKRYVQGKRDEWHDEYRDAWYLALDVIRVKLDAGDVVEHNDIPRVRGSVNVFSEPYRYDNGEPIRCGDYVEPESLRLLLTVLDLMDGDNTVSTNALKELGVGQQVMGHALRLVSAYAGKPSSLADLACPPAKTGDDVEKTS